MLINFGSKMNHVGMAHRVAASGVEPERKLLD